MTHTVHVERFTPDDPRLGRHVEHDERSRSFAVRGPFGIPVSVQHERVVPVLDQGNLGSCTGNAAVGALGTQPFAATLQDVTLDEEEAVHLYSEATALDSFPGQYPSDDTGSSGLAVAKACLAAGLISGYENAFSLDAALDALMVGPVITGTNWYDTMFATDPDGLVSIPLGAEVAGGHEYVVDGYDADAGTVHCTNSWGDGWGDRGGFRLTLEDWQRLLSEDGDVTMFVPLTEPAPVPVDPPIEEPNMVLNAAWLRYRRAVNTWRHAVGLLP